MPNSLPHPRVAVVVATHAYYYPLERCLASFAKQLQRQADVILVDNGSGGQMAAWAEHNAPGVTTLVRDRNGFFCGGYNEGLRHAIGYGYDFALIVNADTEVCNDTLVAELLAVAVRHPRAAFVGPKVFLREHGQVQNTVLTYPSFMRNLKAFFVHKLMSGERIQSDDEERKVEFLNGVCVLCRLSALKEVGLLDETMGGYVEDADWAWRAQSLGWYSLYAPVPSIIHHQPEVGYEHYATKCFMLRRNTIYWHMKCGRRAEARLYGWSARVLGWLRACFASTTGKADRAQYWAYCRRLKAVDKGIRQNREMGPWFGPPFSST